MLDANSTTVRWQAHSLLLCLHRYVFLFGCIYVEGGRGGGGGSLGLSLLCCFVASSIYVLITDQPTAAKTFVLRVEETKDNLRPRNYVVNRTQYYVCYGISNFCSVIVCVVLVMGLKNNSPTSVTFSGHCGLTYLAMVVRELSLWISWVTLPAVDNFRRRR